MKKKGTRRGSGLKAEVMISDELRNIIGRGKCTSASAIKKIWEFIKEYDLQHPDNRRCIILEEGLEDIFTPTRSVKMRGKTIKCPANTIFMTKMVEQLYKDGHIQTGKKSNPYDENDEIDEVYESDLDYDYDDDEYDY